MRLAVPALALASLVGVLGWGVAQCDDSLREVHVRGSGGRPAPGVEVAVGDERAVTGEDGIARFQLRDAAEKPTSAWLPGLAETPTPLASGRTTIDVPTLVPLRVRLVDALTGQPLAGGAITDSSETAPLHAVGTSWLGRLQYEWPPSLDVRLPAGYVWPTGWKPRREAVSRYATRVTVDVPVFPPVRVVIRVVEPDGSPAEDAEVTWEAMAFREPRFPEIADADGLVEIRGLPLLRGETVYVCATKDGRDADEARVRISGPEVSATITLPAKPTIRPGVSRGASFGSGDPFVTPFPRGGSALTIALRRRDGRPAHGAGVRLRPDDPLTRAIRTERTDAVGRVVFDCIPAGRYSFEADEPGLTYTKRLIDVGADASVALEVVEAEGRTLQIQAVDEDGLPLRGAVVRLPVRLHDIAMMDGDDQIVSPTTDLDGRLVVQHCGDDVMSVEVELMSLRGWVGLEPGQTDVTVPMKPWVTRTGGARGGDR